MPVACISPSHALHSSAVTPHPPPLLAHLQDRKAGTSRIGEAGARGMVDVNPPRGTRDFFPEDKRLQNWLFGEFAEVSRLFGFEQVDFPVLESGGCRARRRRLLQARATGGRGTQAGMGAAAGRGLGRQLQLVGVC